MTDISPLDHFGRILVVAPHPDDEVLGCGGTIARLRDHGHDVHVAIVTTGKPPQFPADLVMQIRKELDAAHEVLGGTTKHYLDLPAAALDTIGAAQINGAVAEVVAKVNPDAVFAPFFGDVHVDHQLVFNATLVACRPRSAATPRLVLAYETLSETNWAAPPITPGFQPNVFVDIGDTLERKLAAFAKFESQVKPFPDERSLDTIRALARLRGSTVFRPAAEAFMLVRQIV
ncbi:PIG-L family deacetylase [Qipengyuania sp. XHP0207]|uniref:PIG-L deacetylase family protein n=1 Tax=Qipengyuania sp. XHP0207 TaxID=3038078 RepID=UPI00241D717A|nr:PIG-L deacetylase family protein [Qipengyuania sp. XHP0207]MDG5747729.1 PIG-L family deacetylase [Qipengyuania sp. XHP0207]